MATNNVTVASGLLASRVFEFTDQTRFAEFSGDFNFIHLDNLAARRTQAGGVIVHGMHQLLWVLEQLPHYLPSEARIREVRARFPRPLFVNEVASLSRVHQDDDMLRVSVTTNGMVVTNIAFSLLSGRDATTEVPAARSHGKNMASLTCQELKLEDLRGLAGNMTPASPIAEAQRLFPAASRLIGAMRVNAIAALSQLVGMVCPGLHSMFSALDISFIDTGEQEFLHHSVTTADHRFSHVEQSVFGCGIQGSVKAFMRQAPAVQKSIGEAAQLVGADEFSGAVALVLGASRGLGEFVAKLIAAGGGHVLATYCVGRAECEELASEIKSFGGRCDILAYDARRPAAEQLETLTVVPTSLYYFATNKIFGRPGPIYDATRLREFMQVYVDGFYDLCCCLRPRQGDRLSVVYPSSVAVEKRPPDMTAYAMAKAAGEILCSDISQYWPGVSILTPRLPRLATDQTATMSLADQATLPVSEVMVPIVREAERRLTYQLAV